MVYSCELENEISSGMIYVVFYLEQEIIGGELGSTEGELDAHIQERRQVLP
jgi:hypothetical protein